MPVYQWMGGLEGAADGGSGGTVEGEEVPLPIQLLRGEVVWWVCRLNHPQCVTAAVSLYRSWMERPEELG